MCHHECVGDGLLVAKDQGTLIEQSVPVMVISLAIFWVAV